MTPSGPLLGPFKKSHTLCIFTVSSSTVCSTPLRTGWSSMPPATSMPTPSLEVQQLVRRRMLRGFERRGLLPEDDAQAMAQWEHGGGFSVDASVRIAAADRAGRERLLRVSACCAIAPGHRSPWTGCTNLTPSTCSTKHLPPVPAAPERCASPRCSYSTASPHSSRRRGPTATATTACWHPTRPCAPPSPRSPQPLRRRHRHPRQIHPPPKPPQRALPATPGRCCSPASTKCSPWCVPFVALKCGSSPSSSKRRPGTGFLRTSASPPRHRASRRPAARRSRTYPLLEPAGATPSPSRHRSSSSIPR